jgi:hypothetical protein
VGSCYHCLNFKVKSVTLVENKVHGTVSLITVLVCFREQMLIQDTMNMGTQHYILLHSLEMLSCAIFYLWQVLKVRQPTQLDVLLLRWQLL